MKKKGLNKNEDSCNFMNRGQKQTLYALVGLFGGALLFGTYLSDHPLVILLGALVCASVGYKWATK